MLLCFAITTHVWAESPAPHERLSCNLAYIEAVRLYDYLNSVVRDMGPKIEAANERIVSEYLDELPVREAVNLEQFNLELLALESIDVSVFVQGNSSHPWGEMNFVTKRGPQFIAVRDRSTLPMTPDTAIRKTNFIPNFNLAKKDFINLVVFNECKSDSPYFYTTHYILDDGRDNEVPEMYRPWWPDLPILGSLFGASR